MYNKACRVDVAEWQTRMLEGHVGDRAGSSPVIHTIFFTRNGYGIQQALSLLFLCRF